MLVNKIADSLLSAKQDLKQLLKENKSLIELRSVYLKLTEISDKVEKFRDQAIEPDEKLTDDQDEE